MIHSGVIPSTQRLHTLLLKADGAPNSSAPLSSSYRFKHVVTALTTTMALLTGISLTSDQRAHADQSKKPTQPAHTTSDKRPPESNESKSHHMATTPSPAAGLLTRNCVADAVERVLPSVVNIRRVTKKPAMRMFLTGETESAGMSCGSGFFITDNGLLVTNSHVVSSGDEGSEEDTTLYVTLSSGESYIGRVVASDLRSDIALVKINADAKTPVASLGDSDRVRTGEFVVAVGSPLTLSNSCSFGIVSTIHRDLQIASNELSSGLTYLQLDVAINQGSSGGPCVTLDGDIIGICSMKIAGDAEGIGFAIPIQYARRVVDDLLHFGYVRRPYVGLTLVSVTPDLFEDIRKDTSYRPPRWLEAEMRHINNAKSVGLMVHHVTKGGPGYRAGLRAGDVVIAVNDTKTTSTVEFLAALNFQVDTDCKLTVRRGASGRIDKINIRPEVLQSFR